MAGEKTKNVELVPTDKEGKPVEQNEEQKLMSKTKNELVDLIESNESKHKRQLTRNKNMKEELDELKSENLEMKEELENTKSQQEDTHREAAQMSETIRYKNRILDEVVDAYLTLLNTTRGVSDQGLKILEYNGLLGRGENK